MELDKLKTVFEVNKKQIIEMAASNVSKILEEGNINIIDEYCKARRLNEYLSTYCDSLKVFVRKELIKTGNKLGHNNDELRVTSGRITYDYMQDKIYSELSEQLKKRKELLDAANRFEAAIIDDDGCLVEKVPIKTYGEDILTLTIK